jgi:uncharacterized protein DUF6134
MKLAVGIVGLLLLGADAGAQPAPETLRFAITRNGEQIGTHTVEINRAARETSVSIATDLVVKVLFVTAYRFQHTASERWVNGRLVAFNSATDDNGTRHKVTVALKASVLEMDADGKTSQLDKNIMPGSLWNPELLRRSTMLDTQDGQITPISVVDGGPEELTFEARTVKTRHYTITGRFSQDVWYDEQGRLAQAKLVVARDGSVILYKPM